jgi:D-proline reductase (dithiol) PrdB
LASGQTRKITINMNQETPLNYIARIKEYYQVLGYGEPYRWAHFEGVPFTRFQKPLSEATIGIVTTAARYDPDKGDQGPGAVHNGLAKFYSVYTQTTTGEPDLRISHIAYDRTHTEATDQGSYFPLRALRKLEESGRVGKLSPRFYGLPTNRSQQTSLEVDCVALIERCREDNIDAAVLVPNCPVCHQSVSLAARALEQAGIASVIMGCARDIVEYVGVPRLLFSNFPLGNSAGLPHDPDSQLTTLGLALDLLEVAREPRTTLQSPLIWNGHANWQQDYSNARLLSTEEVARRRAEFDQTKQDAKSVRDSCA